MRITVTGKGSMKQTCGLREKQLWSWWACLGEESSMELLVRRVGRVWNGGTRLGSLQYSILSLHLNCFWSIFFHPFSHFLTCHFFNFSSILPFSTTRFPFHYWSHAFFFLPLFLAGSTFRKPLKFLVPHLWRSFALTPWQPSWKKSTHNKYPIPPHHFYLSLSSYAIESAPC